jgi:hypothetical protein
MNANMKALNNTAPPLNIGSFVTAPVNAMKNAANNVATSVKNVFNNVGPAAASITDPIAESINATIQNNSTVPIVSVPIIVSLGIFIVLFIIVVMFRQQIAMGLEVAWAKIKDFLGLAKKAVQPPPPEFVPESQFFDQGAIEKALPGRKEVFNVAQNKYNYTDAEPLCKAFGAELATYDQVKDAWQKGADWCNYGWVKGQAAIYPTQQSTFDKLQAGPEGQRMACGVPGVNGGYFDNPEMRFGVNCYGAKPSENETDAREIMAQNGDLTPEALAYDRKVLSYKSEMGQIPVNPFKPGTWSS